MFVRFRATKTTLQVSLLAGRRVGGRARQERVAALGAIKSPLTVSGRAAFWRELHAILARLENGVSADAHAKILASVQARIPTVTAEERCAHEIALAEREREVWDTVCELLGERAVGQAELASEASAARAARASAADAAARLSAAGERIERLRRGEQVSPGEELDVERCPETHAAVLATLDRTASLLADSPTPMESMSEEASEEAKDQSQHD